MRSIKKSSLVRRAFAVAFGLAVGATVAHADTISDNYATGDTLTATHMNNIKSAVNGSDAKITTNTNAITTLNTTVSGHTTAISALQAPSASSACSGNPAVTGDTMVRVGAVCIDKYEASVVSGVARSVAGVLPTVSIDWYAAADACAKAGKRLPTNAEWTMAARNTVVGSCNTNSGGSLANTDANPGCTNSFGVVNMVGNANEWVADWAIANGYVSDGDISNEAVAITRGGGYDDGAGSNVNFVFVTEPSTASSPLGFRCAR
jgi:hypothetical protein